MASNAPPASPFLTGSSRDDPATYPAGGLPQSTERSSAGEPAEAWRTCAVMAGPGNMANPQGYRRADERLVAAPGRWRPQPRPVAAAVGMRPEQRPKGWITLVNRSSTALYSGMVPGLIAGLYQRNDARHRPASAL